MGCAASGMGCTQMLDTRWHDLRVDKEFMSNVLSTLESFEVLNIEKEVSSQFRKRFDSI